MTKSFFLAMGIFMCLLGSQCLVIEKFVLKSRDPVEVTSMDWMNNQPRLGPQRELNPPDWVPWTLLSTGVVVCIYSQTLPKKFAGG